MDSSSDDRSQPFQRLTRWFTPNRSTALRQYRSRARIYDLELLLFEPVRHRAIELLRLKKGDRVLDVGCGTGLSFTGSGKPDWRRRLDRRNRAESRDARAGTRTGG